MPTQNPGSKTAKKKAPSKYNLFVRKYFKEHPNIEFSKGVKQASKLWKNKKKHYY
jgi:hypothetical protein